MITRPLKKPRGGAAAALLAIMAATCVGGTDPSGIDDVPQDVLLAQETMEKGLETVAGHSSTVIGFLRPDPRTPQGEWIIREFARDEFGLSEADTDLLVRRMKENRRGALGSDEFVPILQGETLLRDRGGDNLGLSAGEIERLRKIEIRVPGEANQEAQGNK